ncbi:MAG: hypothetical protein Kow00109_28810 [Acidobacteriota bacterium]
MREFFERLKRLEAAEAPDFAAVAAREAEKPPAAHGSAWYRWAWVAAMLVLLVLPWTLWRRSGSETEELPAIATELLSWEAPTDFLLVVESDPLLESVPTIETNGWSAWYGDSEWSDSRP